MTWNINLPSAHYLSSQTRGDDITAFMAEMANQTIVALDTETTGLVSWKDLPLYWSVAWREDGVGKRATLHADLLHIFAPLLRAPGRSWAFANAKYDAHILANVGIEIGGHLIDTQVMHALLYEDERHNLKHMTDHLLGWTYADFQDTFGKISAKQSAEQLIRKAERENMPLLVQYAANDAWATLCVYEELKRQLQAARTFSLYHNTYPFIRTLWDLFEKTEKPYTKVLWRMERRGILLDVASMDRSAAEAKAEIEHLEFEFTKREGMVSMSSPKQMAAMMFDKYKLKPLKMTPSGVPSTDVTVLEAYRHTNESVALAYKHRKYSKLLETYLIGLREEADPFGRVHTHYNQDIARCMPAGELVLTDKGYVAVEKISVGDSVVSHTGVLRKVTECSTHRPTVIYKVKLDNGFELRTSPKHEYLCVNTWVAARKLELGRPVSVYIRNCMTGAHVFDTARVISITVHSAEAVYGLTVEVDHSHVTGGIVTHNTGRLSSSGPNLQNIPKPENDQWGIRGCFIAPEGSDIIAYDYKQLEMRLLASASSDPRMIKVFLDNWDIHMGNAALMYGIPYDDIVKAKDTAEAVKNKLAGAEAMTDYVKHCCQARTVAKTLGFGLNYGMGANKLAQRLGINGKEAKEKIALYMSTYPAVEDFFKEAVKETESTGYAFTVLGRRRNVPQIHSTNRGEKSQGERISTNTPIQGSAADVCRMAQIHIDMMDFEKQYGCQQLLQVHDELVFQCPKETRDIVMPQIQLLMEHPFPTDLKVPLDVDGGYGRSWKEAK